jgi:Uri superfamily endonuclease
MRTSREYSKLNSLIGLTMDISQRESFPATGIYTLIILLSKDLSLNVGRFGLRNFPKGYYTYTGSAMGKGRANLKRRISRHLTKEKPKRWHIDYLLANPNTQVTAVVAAQTNKRLECAINQQLKETGMAKIPVRGFGASDCKENCTTHLLFFPDTAKDSALIDITLRCYGALCLSATCLHV